MRLLWTLEAGLAAPEVNPTIRSADGRFLGIVDLLDVESGLVGEYDGAGHREPTQHADDNAREEGLEEAGLTVVRFGGADLARARRRRSVERLRVGRRRALQLNSQSRGWTWQPAEIDIDVRHAF